MTRFDFGCYDCRGKNGMHTYDCPTLLGINWLDTQVTTTYTALPPRRPSDPPPCKSRKPR